MIFHFRLQFMVNSNPTVAILLYVCKILSRTINVENRHFAYSILTVDPSRGTPSNINVIYTLLERKFSALQFHR